MSIQVVDEHIYHPAPWRSTHMRIIRRLLRPFLVRELMSYVKGLVATFRPDGVFVFKGNAVHPDLLHFFKTHGIPVVNFYPDVSIWTHGPYIPRALPLYDHIFTSKSWGIQDMCEQLKVRDISFLEYGFDPELDQPRVLTVRDYADYGCDVVFIGTWSPKKEKLLAHLKRALPVCNLKIWGIYWDKSSSPELESSIVGEEIIGESYSTVLQASSICLGILSEVRTGASSGDLITNRTFNIPASGAFMLHERNEESVRYFKEDEEAGFFGTPDELVDRVRFYLANPEVRKQVAQRGRERCLVDGYSVDERMIRVVEWFDKRLSAKAGDPDRSIASP